MIDALGLRANCRAYAQVPDDVTLTEVTSNLLAWAALVNDVTASKIVELHYSVIGDISGLTPNTDTTSRNFEEAVVNFNNNDNPRASGIAIPGVRDSLVSGGKLIDGSGALHTLITAMLAGWTFAGSEGTGGFTDPGFHPITSLRDTFLSNRSRTKAVSSKTKTQH
jgi:hypothetical protein